MAFLADPQEPDREEPTMWSWKCDLDSEVCTTPTLHASQLCSVGKGHMYGTTGVRIFFRSGALTGAHLYRCTAPQCEVRAPLSDVRSCQSCLGVVRRDDGRKGERVAQPPATDRNEYSYMRPLQVQAAHAVLPQLSNILCARPQHTEASVFAFNDASCQDGASHTAGLSQCIGWPFEV